MKRKPVNAAKLLTLFGLTLLVAGCVETAAQKQPDAQTLPPANMAPREGVSPHGASVQIDISDVPGPVFERLSPALERQARGREINLADTKTANYLARGHLNAVPAEGGASFALVWDVYDAKKRHTQRIDDRVFVKGATADLDGIDDGTMNLIAAKSAEDLAAVLSNMPEAIAAASLPAAQNLSAARSLDAGTSRVAGSLPLSPQAVPKDTGIGLAAALH